MDQVEHYLYRVAPLAQGWYISVHIKGNKGGFPGWVNASYEAAAKSAKYWRGRGCDVYLSMGGQKEHGEHKSGVPNPEANRQHTNIGCLRSLRMDIDAKQYPTIRDMDAAVEEFYQKTGIPKAPFAVKSGSGGYHLYWPFDRLVDPREWQPLANALAIAAVSTGLKFDTECTVDRTRILRIPGTKNYKDKANPTNVEIYYDDGTTFTYEELQGILTQWLTASSLVDANGSEDGDNDERNMQEGGKTYTPADIELVRKECGFVDHSLNTGGAGYSETLWHKTTAIACHTTDPSGNAHRMAEGYELYQYDQTEDKLKEAQRQRQLHPSLGPPKCATIERAGATQCATCRHRNDGTTPISFGFGRNGHTYSANPNDDLPKDYRRDDNGKILYDAFNYATQQKEIHNVLSVPIIYNSARLENGQPYTLVFNTLEGKAEKVIRVTAGALTDASALAKLLGEQGCVIISNKWTRDFMVSFTELLKSGNRLITIDPIGWYGAGFSFNGTHYTKTGNLKCKIIDAKLKYGVLGDDNAWRSLADVIVCRKRLDLSTLVAAGFAAPLVTFTGHSGFLVGGWSSKTGVGKTTALSLAQGIWGSPAVMNGLNDTANHIIDKTAVLKNLAIMHDEIKDKEQSNSFLKTVTALTQGREKGRSNRDGSMRNVREWETEIIYAANMSMIDAAEDYSRGTAALMVRMFETECEGYKSHDEFKVQRIVAALKNNYGNIGQQYAAYLGANRELVDKFVVQQQDWFKNKIGYNEGERFWFAAAGTLTAGSYLAKMLKFAPFEPTLLQGYLCEVIQALRIKRKDISTDYSNRNSVVNDLANFLKEHQATGTIVTNTILTSRGQPKKGAVVVKNFHPMKRWDALQVHIGLEPHMIRFSDTALGRWCRENNIPKENLVQAMVQNFGASKGTAILGSGVELTQLATKVMEKAWTIATEGTALDKEIEWGEYL